MGWFSSAWRCAVLCKHTHTTKTTTTTERKSPYLGRRRKRVGVVLVRQPQQKLLHPGPHVDADTLPLLQLQPGSGGGGGGGMMDERLARGRSWHMYICIHTDTLHSTNPSNLSPKAKLPTKRSLRPWGGSAARRPNPLASCPAAPPPRRRPRRWGIGVWV